VTRTVFPKVEVHEARSEKDEGEGAGNVAEGAGEPRTGKQEERSCSTNGGEIDMGAEFHFYGHTSFGRIFPKRSMSGGTAGKQIPVAAG
jgi:hypothetical protein